MNSIKLKRGNAKGCLTRAASFVDSIDESISSEMLEIRLSRLCESWAEFSLLHSEYLHLIEETEVQEVEREFGEYEEKYFKAHSCLKKAIREKKVPVEKNCDDTVGSVVERLATQQSSFLEKLSSSNTWATVNLPKIVIPSFSGNYKDWPSFRDLFMGSVENQPKLTPTQKFHYLKSFLKDDAASVIKHIPISDANYVEAWERLEQRYDRVHLIVQSFVQTFHSLPPTINPNAQVLRKITDGADEVIRGLNALDKTGRDPWLIYILLTKLDQDTKQAWAEEVGSRDDVSINDMIEFLERRCDALETCQSLNRSTTTRAKTVGSIRAHVANASDSNLLCPVCKGNHHVAQCPKFIASDINSRRSLVKTHSLCFNCLRPGHCSNKCRSSFRCRSCKSRHHSLVHTDDLNHNRASTSSQIHGSSMLDSVAYQSQSAMAPSTIVASTPMVSNHSIQHNLRKQTVLPTVLAYIQDNQGRTTNCRVLLDTGSQSSFISDSFAQRLGLPRKHSRIPILGLSSKGAGHTKGCVSIELCSRFNTQTRLPVDALVLSKLTSNLPSKQFDASAWAHIRNLDLADPYFNVPGSIDLLLGADRVWTILEEGRIHGPDGIPLAQNTLFGWVVTGELFEERSSERDLHSFHSVLDTDSLLRRFWEMEECPSFKHCQSFNDAAEEHFKNTVSRASDGKYVVSLPFKTPSPSFSDTLQSAVYRLHGMERRFCKNSQLHEQYSKFMKEYLDLGHMEEIRREDIAKSPEKVYYLPHHAILKPESSSTKLRVVFDGSVKDSKGLSLNSQLLVGPPIQRDLIGVCLRFREHRFVFTADIVKMFRQIWVCKDDLDYQRIVWRQSSSEPIKHYRLKTVTYGTASAPFLSVRVLQQLAEDYQSQYPNASRILLNDVYVDDILTGAHSVETLLDLQSELVSLLSVANLHLRKWSSNCWALLAKHPSADCEYSFERAENNSLIKVLGMYWNPSCDIFSFRGVQSKISTSVTRRNLLSDTARIFDPLGLLSPSVVLLKIMFQELWSSELNLAWDDPLPEQLAEKWFDYRSQFHLFEQIRVPRNIFPSNEGIELHGFSDASSVAYAAVVYARVVSRSGKVTVTIVAAKTKVAPIKPISIPRLELCGALLLTRLLNLVKSSVTAHILRTFAWCDSQIVLHWLASPPRRWTTFIANRTSAILETIPRHSWRYVPSESNPADCASRGLAPSKLIGHNLWWTGPHWLLQLEHQWPKTAVSERSKIFNNQAEREEKPAKPARLVLVSSMDTNVIQSLIDKTSSWNRLQRIVAYCVRFAFNCRTQTPTRLRHGLRYSEIETARILIIKHVQSIQFAEDIRHLREHNQLASKSRLLRYSAFLDKDGLLRVGGRIKHSSVSFAIKHPLIIPKTSHVSVLIIQNIHQRYLHAGVSETFSFVRQQFWIMGSRNLIRSVIYKCKPCFMQRTSRIQQLMGDLPSYRIQPGRPFINTGCDYAGPIAIKYSRCRKPKILKAYIALFVCMTTKAIHLEVVSDLTTDAFLAALRRFVARRGRCTTIYSDNGTNFQGAHRYLTDMHRLVLDQTNNDIIVAALAKDHIDWQFIPPHAPHFGGLWEAGVKSVKLHLRRVIGSSILTFEELYTVLTQIEAVLNSRPLCSMSDIDLNPITPAHFLIGEPLTAVPDPEVTTSSHNRRSHWNHLQNMVQGFWKRWHNEYLTTLQERPKWQRINDNLKPGDLVAVKEPNLPPTKWLLGRVEDVSPGADQLVRVASVRTTSGTIRRPITKLAMLPVS